MGGLTIGESRDFITMTIEKVLDGKSIREISFCDSFWILEFFDMPKDFRECRQDKTLSNTIRANNYGCVWDCRNNVVKTFGIKEF
jgi:hypothetical protein